MSASHHGDYCDDCRHHVDSCGCIRCASCDELFNPGADLANLCQDCEGKSRLEEQLEASLTGDVASRFELPSEAQLIAVDAQLSRLLREGPPRRQGITPKATAQKE
jgi:hypothetical protein